MENLVPDRKLYLLAQSRQMRSMTPNAPSAVNKYASYSPATATSFLPKLVPQLTGDSVMKRFSISNFTGWGVGSSNTGEAEANVSTNPSVESRMRSSSVPDVIPEPLVPQVSGGLFGSWWNRSATPDPTKVSPLRPDFTGGPDTSHDPAWYVAEIQKL